MAQVLNYHDAVVYDTDVGLFGEGGWLNDNCINWYFRVLEHEVFKGRTELLFMDPAVVACMMHQCDEPEEFVDLGRGLELESRSMVFVPVNNATGRLSGGSHWSLLVFERRGNGGDGNNSSRSSARFRHFDSSEGCNRTPAERTAANFLKMFDDTGDAPSLVEHVRDTPQQTNSFDCGMYTVLMAEGLAARTGMVPIPATGVAQDEVTTSSSPERMVVAPRLCGNNGPHQVKESSAIPARDAVGVQCRIGRVGGEEGIMAAAKEGRFDNNISYAGGMVVISPEFVANTRILASERLSRCIRA